MTHSRRYRSWARNAILLTTGLMTVCALGELYLQTTNFRFMVQGTNLDFPFEFDRQLLFRAKPLSTPELDIHGFRMLEPSSDSQQSCTILLLGDSFTYGYAMPREVTFAFLLNSRRPLGCHIVNWGTFAYGPDQSLRQLQLLPRPGNTRAAVLTLYLGNDLEDIAQNELFDYSSTPLRPNPSNPIAARLPASRLQALITVALAPNRLFNVSLYQQLFLDRDAELAALSEAAQRERLHSLKLILSEMRDLLHPVPLVVHVIPRFCPQPEDHPGCATSLRMVTELLNNGAFDWWETKELVDPASPMYGSRFLPNQHHLSPTGHVAVAATLERNLKSMLQPPEAPSQ